MMLLWRPTFLLSLVFALPTVLGGTIQRTDLVLPSTAGAHRDAVEKMFLTSYEAYKQFAYGHDELLPVSKAPTDPRNGWGATIVDAMGTMQIMGLKDLFADAVNFTSTIDFSKSQTPSTVSLFETTIRYVGGLLSAYELSGEQYPILVTKAAEVADKLAFGFTDASKVPFGYVNFSNNSPVIATSNIAEAGTLTLEWSTLSKYTGNDTYRQLAEQSAICIAGLSAPLPGLPAQGIDPSTGQSVGGYVTWGGGSDSYFEYLIKYARLNNTDDPIFADSWRTAVDSSIRKLLKTSTVGDFSYLADLDDQGLICHVGSHLACFYGGNWLFGGQLLSNQTIVDIGLALVDACWNTYASTATGIGPEVFAYMSSDGGYTGSTTPLTPDQSAFYLQHGFYITASDYIQRPEVLESNFYAWRVTGDTKYLDRAASAIASFNKSLPAPAGFAGLNDVNNATVSLIDDMESFWFAEVLKYLYLTFDDPSHISLDEYVFNTEAHPFKAPPAKDSYGTGNLQVATLQPFKVNSGILPAISPNPALPIPLKTIINPDSVQEAVHSRDTHHSHFARSLNHVHRH